MPRKWPSPNPHIPTQPETLGRRPRPPPAAPLTCTPLQDLDYLSEGLEGRSQSPVALLFDALLRPDTDFGGNMKSVLTWKHQKEHAIPHVVLGRNLPGGAWHVSGAARACLVGGALSLILPSWSWDSGISLSSFSTPQPCLSLLPPPSPNQGLPCPLAPNGFRLAEAWTKAFLFLQSIEGSMVTLSQGQWMGLPDLEVKDWMQKKRR